MRVDITGEQPDVQHLHSAHTVMDTFDLYILLYLLFFLIGAVLVCCTGVRLFRRRNDLARFHDRERRGSDSKKRE